MALRLMIWQLFGSLLAGPPLFDQNQSKNDIQFLSKYLIISINLSSYYGMAFKRSSVRSWSAPPLINDSNDTWIPLESRPKGQLSCFPPPNKKVGSPRRGCPRSIPSPRRSKNEQTPRENFQGVVFYCPSFNFGSEISDDWIGRWWFSDGLDGFRDWFFPGVCGQQNCV